MRAVIDNFIISCHPSFPKPVWQFLSSGPYLNCSRCTSIHPDEFICQVQQGNFIGGFFWDGERPEYCETLAGRFFVAHLLDMPVDWLHENALLIFEATGLIFYWEGETLKFNAPHVGYRLGAGSACRITASQRAQAQQIIESRYYRGLL